MSEEIHMNATWQLFYKTRTILGEKYLTKLYSRQKTTVFTWSADPTYCAEIRRNPLDRIRDNFRDLHEAGETEGVVEAANILLEDIGYEASPIEGTEPESNIIERECLMDNQALEKFHGAVLSRRGLKYVRRLAKKVKEKINGTLTLYKRIKENAAD